MKRAQNLVISVTMLATLAGSLEGQQANRQAGVTHADVVAVRLMPLDTHTRVRVFEGEHAAVEGTFGGSTSDTMVVIRNSGDTTRVPLSSVHSVWKQSRSAGTGAIIGGSIAGAVGAGLGILLVAGLCEQSSGCGSDYLPVATYVGAVGAAGGAVIGGAIGFLVKRWVRIDH